MIKKLLRLWKWRREVRTAVGRISSIYEGAEGADALGGLTDEEISGLIRWLPPQGTVVEIGTLFGLTAIELARHSAEGVKIIAVDNFCWNPFGLPKAAHENFTRRILRPWIENGKIDLLAMDSLTFRDSLKQAPEMVFLDADHRYETVKEEILWAKKIGVKIICGHDYGNKKFGVTKAVDEAFPAGIEKAGMCWRGRYC